MHIYKPEEMIPTTVGSSLSTAVKLLQQGEVVAIPTETVYGLAANAYNEAAVRRIYAIKNRPLFNPLIVHVSGIGQAAACTQGLPHKAIQLFNKFSPGPLTLLLPKNNNVPDIVTAGLPDVAIRIPGHALTLGLLQELNFPLAAPSANPFGYISPTTATHVHQMLGGKIKYILDGGACNAGIESTIVGFRNDEVLLFREGAIPVSLIEKLVGPVKRIHTAKPSAPGMLASHYQPHTPLYLVDDVEAAFSEEPALRTGIITYNELAKGLPSADQVLLCTNNDFATAARKLYAAMHTMDARGYDRILVRRFPDTGIGVAMNDRLERAAWKGVG